MFAKRKSSNDFDSLNTASQSLKNYFPDSNLVKDVKCIKLAKPGVCLSGNNESATLYDFYKGKKLKVCPSQQSITKIAYGISNSLIFYASRDKTINIWKEDEDQPLHIIKAHRLPITGLDLNSDNRLCCSGSRDNSIKIWDVHTGKQLNVRVKARNLITHLVWFPNSHLALQSSEDKTIRVWDTRNLEVASISPEKRHIQTYCNINPLNNNYVLSCSSGTNGDGCEITLWDIRKMEILSEYWGHDESVNATMFLSGFKSTTDSPQIASVSSDLTIKIWDQATKSCLACSPVVGATSLNDLEDFADNSFGVATNQSGIQRYLRGQTFDGHLVIRPVSAF